MYEMNIIIQAIWCSDLILRHEFIILCTEILGILATPAGRGVDAQQAHTRTHINILRNNFISGQPLLRY